MNGLSSNSTEDLDRHFRLLDYHQKAMESRRQIQFRVFLSLVALYLILTKGMAEYPYHDDGILIIKITLTIVLAILWLLLIGFVVQMEIWNKSNREK